MADVIPQLKALVAILKSPDYQAHPRAAELVLPDGTGAPEELRVWASLDRRYPTSLAARRSQEEIANDEGVVLAREMRDVLRDVCVEDVRAELEGDDATLEYLAELATQYARELPGFGARLEAFDYPDRVLWFRPDGEAWMLWYENDRFDRRERFASWVLETFEDDDRG